MTYCTAKATSHLCTCIRWPFLPGKATEHAIGECNSRVEVASRTSSNVNTKHHAEAPAGIVVSAARDLQSIEAHPQDMD
jgi:hypothetical protein